VSNKVLVVFCLGVLFLLSQARGAVIYVPGDVPNIQAGVDASVDGDTVLVADGTFTGVGNRDIDIYNKSISVISENGSDSTRIDCQDSGRGFTLGAGSDSVIQGFEIIRGNTITFDEAGAGILCENSALNVMDCVFIECISPWSGGGALAIYDSSVQLLSSSMIRCVCVYGALHIGYSEVTINNCTISENRPGGIDIGADSTVIINNSLITNNYSPSGNSGQGIDCYISSFVSLENCILSGNYGLGAPIYNRGSISILNSIIWNLAQWSQLDGWGEYDVTYSNILDGYSGTGNIDADPLFICGLAGCYYLSSIESGQSENSPCIDSGSEDSSNLCFEMPDGPVCLDTLTNRTDQVEDTGIADMGFHYFILSMPTPQPPQTIHVPQDFSTLQEGIDAALEGDTVLVASGFYSGFGNRNINFSGKAISVVSESGPASTTMDGMNVFGNRGFRFDHQESSNSILEGFTIRRFCTEKGAGIYLENASPVIKNCVISENNSAYSENSSYGLGLYCSNASPTVINCQISHNYDNYYPHGSGPGIFIHNDSSPVFVSCEMNNNIGDYGAGLSCVSSDLFLYDCSIHHNQAKYLSGAIRIHGSEFLISGCRIYSNTTEYDGDDGIRIEYSHGTMANCLIYNQNNDALKVYNSEDLNFENCTFISSWNGNPTYNYQSTLSFNRCIIDWQLIRNPNNITVNHSNINGGFPGEGNFDLDSLFVSAPGNDYHLSHIAAGQSEDSPCIDAGGMSASELWYYAPWGWIGLAELTTRTDDVTDSGVADIGYHYIPFTFVTPTPTSTWDPTWTPTVTRTPTQSHTPIPPTYTPSPIPPTSTPSNLPATYTPSPPPTPSQAPTDTPTHTPSPLPPTSTPSPPSPTPTPSSLPDTPIPTSTPEMDAPSVTLRMSSSFFVPGDLFECEVVISNPFVEPLIEQLLFVIMEIHGSYYFAPSFSQFDYYRITFLSGETVITVIDPLIWPDHVGHTRSGFMYAALTNSEITEVIGEMDIWPFGWGTSRINSAN